MWYNISIVSGTVAQYFIQELFCKEVDVYPKEVENSADTEKSFLLCWHPALSRKMQLFNHASHRASSFSSWELCAGSFQTKDVGPAAFQAQLWDTRDPAVVWAAHTRCAVLISCICSRALRCPRVLHAHSSQDSWGRIDPWAHHRHCCPLHPPIYLAKLQNTSLETNGIRGATSPDLPVNLTSLHVSRVLDS